MSQPSEGSQPSTAPHDQPGGSREPARGRKRRAPAWSSAEIVDLIEVWGEASNVHDLRTSQRNAAVYGRMAASLAARGHQRSREQVRCKIKDLRQSYSRACLPEADPEACPHFHALDRILGPHAVPAPRDVIDPGAEGPLLDTEEEEEGSESHEPAASLPRTRDPRGTPQSRSPASSEAGEASTCEYPRVPLMCTGGWGEREPRDRAPGPCPLRSSSWGSCRGPGLAEGSWVSHTWAPGVIDRWSSCTTAAAPGTAGRTTPPAAAARARASRTARNQEDYQRRHLRFLDRQLRLQDHWVQEDLRLRQRSLEALEEQGRALRGHLQSLLDRFPFPPPPAPPLAPPLAPPAPPLAPPLAPPAPPVPPASAPASAPASSTPPVLSAPPPHNHSPPTPPDPQCGETGEAPRLPPLSFPFPSSLPSPPLPAPSSQVSPSLLPPSFLPPSPQFSEINRRFCLKNRLHMFLDIHDLHCGAKGNQQVESHD
ncbi:uncharacterized protein LOC142827518 [Pelodiscus sinensis]|uniref:uncharacterized protein LOC142827518 n=1 Tax=Pelodiscus sinensis TaxID=13735 RepID=UPI003F6D7741